METQTVLSKPKKVDNLLIYDSFPQGSQEWLDMRSGIITGTRLSRVMSSRKSTRDELIIELLSEAMAPVYETYTSGIMERGHLVEEVVKELYTGDPFEVVGFISRADVPWIGISPDGLIYDDAGTPIRGVEIKGPQSKNTIKYFLSDDIPSEYYWQVVHYFVVMDSLQSLDFVIHNPDMYDERLRTKIVTVIREDLEEDIERAKNTLADFRKDWQDQATTLVARLG